ncbi:MAG: GNAT family N-acetyltransferase [Ferruginibacter sp.]
MDITIRKATKEDCTSMMKLVHELAEYEKMPQEVTIDFDEFVESGFGQKPVWWAFVAEAPSPSERAGGEAIIGFALYYIRFSTWKGQRMYVEDLLVTEKMRGKGIGKLLFNHLIEDAKEKKLNGITWQVLDWNEPAINFYKKLGDVQFDGEWLNGSLNI